MLLNVHSMSLTLVILCSVVDLRKVLTEMGEKVDESQLRDLIAEVDLNKNNTIEEDEFLQVHKQSTHNAMSCIIE